MLRNYFKIALRNIWKGRGLSAINIFGLSIGISASLVIWMIVYYDLSFEKDRPNKDRIYRVVTDLAFGDQTINTAAAPYPMAAAIRSEIPGVEKVGHTFMAPMDVRTGEDKERMYEQHDLCFADPDFFAVYQYNWLYGNPQVLVKPYQVVLTKDRAATYFPGVALMDVIGRTLIYRDSLYMTVAGIVQPYEGRTAFVQHDFMSLSTMMQDKKLKANSGHDAWDSFNSDCNVHLLLRPDADAAKIEHQIQLMADRYTPKDDKEAGTQVYHIQNLMDFHFDGKHMLFDKPAAHLPTMYRLGALAVFLLLLGCINFINMQTAQATERAREIGIRKTMGSSRGSLVGQFLGESLLMASLAGIVSILLVPVILNVFRSFLPAGLNISMLGEWQIFAFIPVLIGITGLLAGFYPALILSRFQPVLVLKNQMHGVRGKARMRQVLTVAQFMVALIFIMATLIISTQTQYAFKKELGFQKERRLTIRKPFLGKPLDAFRDQLKAMPEVVETAYGTTSPSSPGINSQMFSTGDNGLKEASLLEVKYVDSSYIPLYNLQLIAGRNLFSSETRKEYVVNEAFVKRAGFASPEAALGQLVRGEGKGFPIVGVVRDFHTKSIRQQIQPLLLCSENPSQNMLHIAIRDGVNREQFMAKLENTWKTFYPANRLNAGFVDQVIERFYDDEKRLIKLLSWATGVAICISCLGLLGLAIYNTRQRTKEIGVRKVLGASVASIIALFSADVVKLVIIAIILATPIAWYAMHNWLNDFAYHIPVPWWVFPIAGLSAIALALLTVGIQSLKAAWANPVRSLRTE